MPSWDTNCIEDWETKVDAVVEETKAENMTLIAGIPSWVQMYFEKLIEKSKKPVGKLFKNFSLFVYGGVNYEPYRPLFEELIGKKVDSIELFPASEGFFAYQDQQNNKGLLLLVNHGIFYEFIPMDTYDSMEEIIIPLSEVQLDKNYAIVITTNAGLWRYKIGDTIRFTSINPYRIKVTGRTKHHINVFGEELIIENAEAALRKAAKLTHSEIIDYTAGPIFMEGKEKGAHEWIIEFKKHPYDIDTFNQLLDAFLQEVNSDYEAKRYRNITLKFPKIHTARKDLFKDWLKQNDKLGGQHKIPRLSNSREFLEELLKNN
jgi:hypothetical protein